MVGGKEGERWWVGRREIGGGVGRREIGGGWGGGRISSPKLAMGLPHWT